MVYGSTLSACGIDEADVRRRNYEKSAISVCYSRSAKLCRPSSPRSLMERPIMLTSCQLLIAQQNTTFRQIHVGSRIPSTMTRRTALDLGLRSDAKAKASLGAPINAKHLAPFSSSPSRNSHTRLLQSRLDNNFQQHGKPNSGSRACWCSSHRSGPHR